MTVVINLVLVLHLLGMAAIVGGWIAGRFGATPMTPILWGARAQLVTGIVLVGLHESSKDPVNHAKVGLKLLVALGAAAAAEMARVRSLKGGESARLLDAAGGLAILNVAIAALWDTDS